MFEKLCQRIHLECYKVFKAEVDWVVIFLSSRLDSLLIRGIASR
jgi:hypothetical protein